VTPFLLLFSFSPQVTRGGTVTIGGGFGTPGTATPTGMPVSMAEPTYDGNGKMTSEGAYTYV
jgi:hypothetical protein